MKEKRLQRVEDYIHLSGTVSLDELCQHFQVSKNTIRRDLESILVKGTIQKVYGGVMSVSHNLVPFENRDHTNSGEKVAIAKRAAELIRDNDIIFIDSGTTTRCIMEFLPSINNLTVLTNSLDVINAAANMDNVTLLTVGNQYKRKTKSFVTIDDLYVLDKYNITRAFMSATGVSLANGVTNSDILEHEIKKRVVIKAQETYLLADATKFGKSTLLTYAALDNIQAIITSTALPEDYRHYFNSHHIAVYLTDAQSLTGD